MLEEEISINYVANSVFSHINLMNISNYSGIIQLHYLLNYTTKINYINRKTFF